MKNNKDLRELSLDEINAVSGGVEVSIVTDFSSLSLDQTLASLVDGNLGTQQVNPPSGGWQAGGSFKIDLKP